MEGWKEKAESVTHDKLKGVIIIIMGGKKKKAVIDVELCWDTDHRRDGGRE